MKMHWLHGTCSGPKSGVVLVRPNFPQSNGCISKNIQHLEYHKKKKILADIVQIFYNTDIIHYNTYGIPISKMSAVVL